MIVLILFLKTPDNGEVSFVRHYKESPWPRVPCKGEAIYLYAPDVLVECEVQIRKATFDPDGDIVLILEEQVDAGFRECIEQITDAGFIETRDPFARIP